MEKDQLEEASDAPPKVLDSEVMSVTGEPPGSARRKDETAQDIEVESIPEYAELQLSLLEVLRISAVLEDATDQLSILNYIMPIQYERSQSTSLKSREATLEEKSPDKAQVMSVTSQRSSPPVPVEGPKLPGIREDAIAVDPNRTQDFVFKKPIRQSIMTTEALKKIQIDRKGRKQIKTLQKQLLNAKKERQIELQNRNEYIAHLRDQLQEMKAKTNMENCYMKKNTELQITQTHKKCARAEEQLLDEIEEAHTPDVSLPSLQKLRMKTEEENRIHMEIEAFLKKEQQKLEEKLEFWMEKFDKDTETKQNELNALKATKASDLAHLQDLAKLIREYEQVIIEDRLEKEKSRKRIQQDELELRSVIKLQAWWRGTVVRNEIGSFKLPTKDKDDSKDSKGKGKDKKQQRGKK
ncbi:dynein regulatory complex protein 9 [Echinops telfairi]|uniref:Dynein regulatory complex protein 9 n=1 Tax=Echinops telfairi TaxID=9371 RepID=A0AC55CVE0_ECHTE|nr:dynein regulatory complex protein 9 [Echinops telfairi]